MDISEKLNSARDAALSNIQSTATDLGTNGLIFDALMTNESGAPRKFGPLQLPRRFDLITSTNNPEECHFSHNHHGEALSISWQNTIRVDLYDFHWNACPVRVHGLKQSTRWHPLKDWYLKHFQPDSANGKTEPLGVLHAISGPKVHGEFVEFEIDFGTAPIEVFEELLTTFIEMGFDHIYIGKE